MNHAAAVSRQCRRQHVNPCLEGKSEVISCSDIFQSSFMVNLLASQPSSQAGWNTSWMLGERALLSGVRYLFSDLMLKNLNIKHSCMKEVNFYCYYLSLLILKCSTHGVECANWLSSLLKVQFSGKWLAQPSSLCDYSNVVTMCNYDLIWVKKLWLWIVESTY